MKDQTCSQMFREHPPANFHLPFLQVYFEISKEQDIKIGSYLRDCQKRIKIDN